MGDEPQNTVTEPSEVMFSAQQAESAARLAALPHIYEKTYYDGKDRGEAMESVRQALPENIEGINVINIDNTTAIMAYNPDDNRVTIAFDPTHTGGDRWDNFRRGHMDHALGGEVHKGLYQDIIEEQNAENFPGDNMTDVIGAVLHDYASRNPETPLSVDFTGFSSGGAQTAFAAGQMIAEGFFEDNPNIHLDNIYTFGSPAYGDQDFTNALENATAALGADTWMIQIHGDNMPSVLSPDGSNMFTKFDYGHAGDHIYIVNGQDGAAPDISINPSEETLETLAPSNMTSKETHTMDSYIKTMENLNQEPSSPALSPEEQSLSPISIGPK